MKTWNVFRLRRFVVVLCRWRRWSYIKLYFKRWAIFSFVKNYLTFNPIKHGIVWMSVASCSRQDKTLQSFILQTRNFLFGGKTIERKGRYNILISIITIYKLFSKKTFVWVTSLHCCSLWGVYTFKVLMLKTIVWENKTLIEGLEDIV